MGGEAGVKGTRRDRDGRRFDEEGCENRRMEGIGADVDSVSLQAERDVDGDGLRVGEK